MEARRACLRLRPSRARRTALAALTVLVLGALGGPSTPASPTAAWLAGGALGLDALDPAVARAAAPALAEWIRRSRAAAESAGTTPIPAAVRDALAGYVPAGVLDAVRWCRACGDVLSLQQSVLGFARVPAVTLDDVIVFATSADIGDPALWAHELYHVMQYAEWGVDGFAERYLEDYGAVEHPAAEFRWLWMKRARDPRTVAPALRSGREAARAGNEETAR